jgi:hypothetical protein
MFCTVYDHVHKHVYVHKHAKRNVPVHLHNCENRHVHGHNMDNVRHGHGCGHERGNSCGRLHGCGREDGLRHERGHGCGRKCGLGCGCAHGHECGVNFYISMDLLYMYKKVTDGVKLRRYFTAKDVLWDINEKIKNRIELSNTLYHSREADTYGIPCVEYSGEFLENLATFLNS